MFILSCNIVDLRYFVSQYLLGFPSGSNSKESAYNARDLGSISGLGRSPGGGMAWQPIPVFLPEESPWTKEPGGLQAMGSQGVRHD